MTIYHGSPFSDLRIAAEVYRGRHALISHARPAQLELAAEVGSSFGLDSGAFSAWRAGLPIRDWSAYYRFVERWKNHPGCSLVLIPDVIEAPEEANDALIDEWPFLDCGVPIWHLHESLDRLLRLSRSFIRIALGSSGRYRTPGSLLWWDRMFQVMELLCDEQGYPTVKLHGLRMLAPDILEHLPLASADSTTVCRNVNLDTKWRGTYCPATRLGRALALTTRIETVPVAKKWMRDAASRMRSEATPPYGQMSLLDLPLD
jgi:hypothetical protein